MSTDSDKIDIVYKRTLFNASATNQTHKYFEEQFINPALVQNDRIAAVVFPTTSPFGPPRTNAANSNTNFELVKDLLLTAVDGSPKSFYDVTLADSISYNHDPNGSYLYHVTKNGGGDVAFGEGDWVVDNAAGTLTFYGEFPTGVSQGLPPRISFYRYIGSTGITSSDIDHNLTQNLTVGDPHTQYVLLAGRAGGQNVTGGTASGNNLTLQTNTSNDGSLVLGTLEYNESTDRLRVGTGSSVGRVHVNTAATGEIGIVTQGLPGQTAALQEWRDNSANVLMSFDQEDNRLTIGVAGSAAPTPAIGVSESLIARSSTSLTTGGDFRSALLTSSYQGASTRTNVSLGAEVYTAVDSNASITVSGSTPGLTGIRTTAGVHGTGTIDRSAGIVSLSEVDNSFAGVITDASGFYASGNEAGGGTLTNSYLYYGADSDAETGTITNSYGLYLENINSGDTLNYGIYSAGGDNYFAGDVGIGVPSPGAALDIVGNIDLTGTVDGRDVALDGTNQDNHIANTSNPHSVTAAQVGNTTAQWNANELQGFDVHTTTPTDGQILVWDNGNSRWAPSSDIGGGTKKIIVSVANTFAITATSWTTIGNFTWIDANYDGFSSGAVTCHMTIGNHNGRIRLRNITTGSNIGGPTTYSSTQFITQSFTLPIADAQLEVQMKKTNSGGGDDVDVTGVQIEFGF